LKQNNEYLDEKERSEILETQHIKRGLIYEILEAFRIFLILLNDKTERIEMIEKR
jgi:hypothetical protein